jgi:hypothetical protein
MPIYIASYRYKFVQTRVIYENYYVNFFFYFLAIRSPALTHLVNPSLQPPATHDESFLMLLRRGEYVIFKFNKNLHQN